jgi:hypothetical protein
VTQKHVKGIQAFTDEGAAHVHSPLPLSVHGYVWNPNTLSWEPEEQATGGSASSPVRMLFEEASATVSYKGEAAPGTATSSPAWRIQRITTSGALISIQWAGSGAFSQVWDDRSSLTYL